MEAVVDKLKLLEYEAGLLRPRSLPPLPRGYFASSTLWPTQPQFAYLFSLVCWLASAASARPYECPNDRSLLAEQLPGILPAVVDQRLLDLIVRWVGQRRVPLQPVPREDALQAAVRTAPSAVTAQV